MLLVLGSVTWVYRDATRRIGIWCLLRYQSVTEVETACPSDIVPREREAGVQLLALLLTLTTAPCAGRHQGAFVNGFSYFMKKSGRSRTARSLRVAGLGEKRGNAYLLWRTVLCCFYDYEILWMELSKLHWVHFV
jgi:hypothetical protein